METTKSQRMEEKQEILKDLDTEKEGRLADEFVDYVATLYHDPNTTREEKQRKTEQAEGIYEDILDSAIKVEAEAFYGSWDLADEATRADLYPYLKDYAKAWLDQREEA